MREIASESLEEEDEDDPLIPGVSDLVPIRGDLHQIAVLGVDAGVRVGADPGVREVHPSPPSELGGESEGAVDPAVGVEHGLGDPLHHAVNRLPEELRECLEETADTEDGECPLVVHSERRVVDQTFLQLEQRLKTCEYREHSVSRI